MKIRKILQWSASSLLGHVALFAVIATIPLFILALVLNYEEGTLTLDWVPYLALYAVLAGLAMALLYWFAFTLPLRKLRGRRS